jgi:3-isopropylmalate dehydrogenase
MRIVVLPGDGIGPEITAATTNVLRAAAARFDLKLQLEEHAVGHASRAHLVERARKTD